MAIDTKPNLNSDKFEQYSGDTLNLSGNTNIFKNITIKSGGTLTILSNSGAGKVLVSDASGNGGWEVAPTGTKDVCVSALNNTFSCISTSPNLTVGDVNVAFGSNALMSNVCGRCNIAIGFESLRANTGGSYNIGIGSYTLYDNITGGDNIAFGDSALYVNTIGVGNVAIGYEAGASNITGSSSVYIGYRAGYNETLSNRLHIANIDSKSLIYGEFDNEKLYINGKLYVTGLTNTTKPDVVYYDSTTKELTYGAAPSGSGSTSSLGWSDLTNGSTVVGCGTPAKTGYSNNFNTIYGVRALTGGTGGFNIAIGTCSLNKNTNGDNNVAIGYSALGKNTSGYGNVANGNDALCNNTTGYYNVANGIEALRLNTEGHDNIANGFDALYKNTVGYNNIANGSEALYNNIDGNDNIANGYQALYLNVDGSNNFASGFNTLYSNIGGSSNIAIGNQTLYSNVDGDDNFASGFNALYSNTNGQSNIAIGNQTLFNNTIGNFNIAIGSQTGTNNITGCSNVFIGFSAGFNETLSNRLHIANSVDKSLIYGEFDNEKLYVRGKLYVSGLTASANTNVIYYNTISNELSYGAAPTGGSGTVIISKTYSQLQTLVSTSGLTMGQQYLLTDYQTKHLIPNSSPNVINTGNTEPLILTAVNTYEFDSVVKSTVYPEDIINYRFDDNSCEDGTRSIALQKWTGGTSRNGYVTYRKSTTNNLSTYYDWRNYKVRRWKVDAIAWSGSTSYIKMAVVKSPSDSNIYVAKTTHTGATDPSTDSVNWQLWMDLTIQGSGGFLSFTPTKANFNLGNITTTNLIINNTTQGTDYDDYYTFSILTELNNSSGLVETTTNGGIIGEGFNNFEIGKFDYDYFNYNWGSGTDLESNVFYLQPDGSNEYVSRDNKFGSNITFNTFNCKNFYSNIVGDNFYSNIVGDNLYNNTIENDFYFNAIGNNFINNTIGNDFNTNTIGNNFSYDIIGNGFYFNIIGGSVSNNKIGTNFSNNIIASGFYNNIIGNSYQYNTIANGFQYNTIKNDFISNNIGTIFHKNTIENNNHDNIIGDYFNYNTVGNDFHTNTIGNYMYYNTIGDYFHDNTIGNEFGYNNIENDFYSNSIGNQFQYNETKNSVSNIDWLNALPTPTHVYANYNTTIFMNSAVLMRLSYYDGSDQLIITDITS